MSKFTDKQLMNLYAQLAHNYTINEQNGLSTEDNRDELLKQLESTLSFRLLVSVYSPLTLLPDPEKDKVRIAARTIIDGLVKRATNGSTSGVSASSMPSLSNSSRASRRNSSPNDSHYCCHCTVCETHYPPRIYTWMYIHQYNMPRSPVSVWPGSSAAQFSSNMTTSSGGSTHTKQGDFLAELLVVLILLAAFVAAGFAMYYLYHEMINSGERFIYNEGLLQAAASYLSIVASSVVASMLMSTYAYAPLLSLCISAGFPLISPVLAAGCMVVLLSIAATGLGCLAFNRPLSKPPLGQLHVINSCN